MRPDGSSSRIAYTGTGLHFLSTVTTFGATFDPALDEIVLSRTSHR